MILVLLKVFNWRPREKAVTIWRSSHWRDNLRLSSWCNHHMSMSWMERDANYRVMTRHRCNHRMSMSMSAFFNISADTPSDQTGKGDTLSICICISNTIKNLKDKCTWEQEWWCPVHLECFALMCLLVFCFLQPLLLLLTLCPYQSTLCHWGTSKTL